MGLIYAMVFSMVYFVPRLSIESVGELFSLPQAWVAGISILLGLTVFVYSKRPNVPAKQMLNLGLVFEVVGALGIGMSEFWGIFPDLSEEMLLHGYVGIPWECVWIIGFPLVAPNIPWKVLAASLLAASAGPITIGVSALFGAPLPTSPLFAIAGFFLFTTYLCAGIAYVVSRNIARYGASLKRARDIGSYHLIRQVSSGGMGEVWAATHRMLARPAAIKLIRPEVLGVSQESRDTALKRFEREAKATAKLTSPHTVVVYDFGVTEKGSFFYAMELLNGLDLDSLVDRFGPVSPGRAVYLLSQMCDSLTEAHEAGLIHRDIKPANIFVSQAGNQFDFVKVLDFGLVKTVQADQGSTQLTGEVITGTPAYMAPEQATDITHVDQRTDIYAFGCVMYWLVTGHQVFTTDSPMGTIAEHITSQPVLPSLRAETEIPPALDQLIIDCLEKKPDRRPQTVADLGERLHAMGLSDWNGKMAEEWWRTHMPEQVSGSVLQSGETPLEVVRIAR